MTWDDVPTMVWLVVLFVAAVALITYVVLLFTIFEAAKEAIEFFKRANTENRVADTKAEVKPPAWE